MGKSSGGAAGESASRVPREDSGLCEGGDTAGGKQLDSGFILKVELAGFVGRLDVEFQRKRGVKDGCKRNLAWASRRMELLLSEMGTGKIRSPVSARSS